MLERLKNWAAERVMRSAIAARQRSAMGKREWWSAVAGVSGSGFAGAAINRLTASLAQASNSVNLDLDGNLAVLRSRARALAANNEFARRFLNLVAVNVVGSTGPTLQVRALTQRLELDKPANDAIEMAWARWAKVAELTGRMDLAHAMRIGIKSVARDGEALIRFVRGRDLPHGIQIQVLEADRLDETFNRTLQSGYVRQGVEFDGRGRPVAYWIKSAHPGDAWAPGSTAAERVDARDILHVYLPERAEQVRGYTWLHAVLLRMGMLHAYEEAAVIAARVGAAKMGVFQKKDAGTPSVLEQMADAKDSAGRLQMSAEPGEFMELPAGYELGSWDPEYPHANFESFMKQCMRGVASGLDVATHNLSGDMTDVNYSSARIAELAERDQWILLQEWWNFVVGQRLYREWLASALIRGEVTFPQTGKALPADKLDKFSAVARFQGRRWQWTDPEVEIAAAERAVALGVESRTSIVASKGREFEDVVDELQQEKTVLDAAGLPTQAGKVPMPTPVVPEPTVPSKTIDTVAALATDAMAVARAAAERPAAPVSIHNEVVVPERAVTVQNDVSVPEREVHLEARIENNVDTPPASVVVTQPKRTVETIERDEHMEITRIVREHKD